MQSKLFKLIVFLIISSGLNAQSKDPKDTQVWEPEPRVVTPGVGTAPPSDAIILFDGKNLEEWISSNDDSPAKWTIEGDVMTVNPGTGWIKTKRKFGDCQLHIEWRAPTIIEGDSQDRGNSGVFLQEVYEVQILDSYNNRTYSNGQAGSIYKQYIPLVNAMRPPGEWQVYDIIYKAPRFNEDGIKVASGSMTVIHNGVLIQNHALLQGTTENVGMPKNIAHGNRPIALQDHSNPVSFRNIWVRAL